MWENKWDLAKKTIINVSGFEIFRTFETLYNVTLKLLLNYLGMRQWKFNRLGFGIDGLNVCLRTFVVSEYQNSQREIERERESERGRERERVRHNLVHTLI